MLKSGICIPGNGKALVRLRSASGKNLVAASQHHGFLKLFEQKDIRQHISLHTDDVSALLTYKNGRIEKQEFYYGSSFLSQSARFLSISKQVHTIRIINSKSETRTLIFN